MAATEIIPCCAVCQNPHVYDTEGPFLLPCLHSVCENCLKSENDKTLLCSSCHETFPKSSFPKDAVTRKKIILFKIVHNSNELLCTNREDGNQAMSWCQDCEAFLCEHCHVAHGDMKATRKHKVILVQDMTNCPQTLKCMSYCDQHVHHPVTLFDSSCNAPLCAMCVLAEHKSCKTEDLDSAWATRRTFIEDKGVALRAKLDSLKDCRTLHEDIGQRLKPQQEAVEDVIRGTFQKLRLMLDQREIELKNKIEESTKFLAERNDHQLVTLRSEADKLTMNLEFMQKSILFPNPVEHFAMKDVIDKRIVLVSESEIKQVNEQEYCITFSRDGLHGLQQQISSLGGILTSPTKSADSAKKDVGFQFNLGKVSTPVKSQDKKESSSPFQFTFRLTPSKTPQSKVTVTSPKSPEGGFVSLPDKVDVKTGEEEEVTHFAQRAKLFRFSEGEWKERGLGTMKILEHKTSHRYRLLMRREQIFKVCCNHVITPELELKPMASGDGKSWIWYAKDFSEEKGKVEQLAIKFKNKETADLFKKEFDAGKAGGVKGASAAAEGGVLAKHIEDTSDVQFLYTEEATQKQKARARKYLLPESFYLYENKPPCPGCIGCEDYDPSKVSVPSKVKAKSKSEKTSPAPTTVSGIANSVAGSIGGSEGFSMFGQASGMSFSTLAAQGDAVGFAFKKDENRPFHWPRAGQIIGSNNGDDIDSKPFTELPELVEVKTGEEGWEVVYCQRSKLFRFVRDSNQWKERAVGDMKILKQDDKYRMLMRRDQVHKVACNHLISPSMVLSPMATSETAWCWTAQDYAENEAKIEQFALRFKTEELARQFKKKFEAVQELVRQAEAAAQAKNANNSAVESKTQDASVTEEEDEDDDNDDDESEEESIMFEKRATLTHFENDEWKKLGMGNLKILYNEDLNGNEVDMETDDKNKICNHVICREYTISLEKSKRACMWSAQDFSTDEPVRRNFKASFSSVAAAEEFAKSFMEGVSLARDSELSEKISHEMDTPVIFSHGDATGGLSRILVCQSETSSATSMGGSSQCETRMRPGFSEGSQSAASSQTGAGVSANDVRLSCLLS